MRKVTVDEAVEQSRELIDWVDTAYQGVLTIKEGRVVAELWPADDMWDKFPVVPDSAANQGAIDAPTDNSGRSR